MITIEWIKVEPQPGFWKDTIFFKLFKKNQEKKTEDLTKISTCEENHSILRSSARIEYSSIKTLMSTLDG